MPDPTTAAGFRIVLEALQAKGRRGATAAELAEELGQDLAVVATRLGALARRGLCRLAVRGRWICWRDPTSDPTPDQLARLKQLAQGGDR